MIRSLIPSDLHSSSSLCTPLAFTFLTSDGRVSVDLESLLSVKEKCSLAEGGEGVEARWRFLQLRTVCRLKSQTTLEAKFLKRLGDARLLCLWCKLSKSRSKHVCCLLSKKTLLTRRKA